jgi:hypothetical protein
MRVLEVESWTRGPPFLLLLMLLLRLLCTAAFVIVIVTIFIAAVAIAVAVAAAAVIGGIRHRIHNPERDVVTRRDRDIESAFARRGTDIVRAGITHKALKTRVDGCIQPSDRGVKITGYEGRAAERVGGRDCWWRGLDRGRPWEEKTEGEIHVFEGVDGGLVGRLKIP